MSTREILKRFHLSAMELQLNRPEQRNALTDAMIDTLHETVVQAQENAEISALVIRGNGGYFCAGADLGAMANPTNPDLDALKEIAQEKSQIGRAHV